MHPRSPRFASPSKRSATQTLLEPLSMSKKTLRICLSNSISLTKSTTVFSRKVSEKDSHRQRKIMSALQEPEKAVVYERPSLAAHESEANTLRTFNRSLAEKPPSNHFTCQPLIFVFFHPHYKSSEIGLYDVRHKRGFSGLGTDTTNACFQSTGIPPVTQM